jgi:hypothetical protein
MLTVPERIYGEVVVTRHTDLDRGYFGLTVDRADPLVLIGPEILASLASNDADHPVSLVDDVLTLRGRNRWVAYRLTGWEGSNRIGQRIDDDTASHCLTERK